MGSAYPTVHFDTDKRDKTLRARGLDFARAGEIFADVIITIEDIRKNYGETRWMTVGAIDGRIVILIWTPRGAVRRIISMRYANEREITRYTQ
ncbi:MAG: BrnT family toxin [Leptospirales bacterium]